MRFSLRYHSARPGQAALIAIMFLLGVTAILGGSFTSIALRQTASSHTSTRSLQSYLAAESGLDDAVYRLKTNKKLGAAQTLVVGGATTTVGVLDVIKGKQITATGTQGANFRTEQTLLTTDVGVDFVYAVQVGTGGVQMGSNSQITGVGGAVGNISTQGSIMGGSNAVITGSATASGTIDNVAVYGDVRAQTIGSGAKVCGDAYYQTINATALNFLNNPSSPCPTPFTSGTAHPNQPPIVSSAPLLAVSLIQDWKNDAGCGSQPAVAPCLYSGNYTLSADTTLGPKTITGDLTLNNNKILTVAGTVYVQGNITLNNNSSIHCSPAYGAKSCIVIADGWVDVNNNGTFAGSGSAGSYLMVISNSPCDTTQAQTPPCNTAPDNGAIRISNNATGAIFYAPQGMISLNNNAQVKEVVASMLKLDDNSIAQYEQGLASVDFSSGPSGTWNILDWREIY